MRILLAGVLGVVLQTTAAFAEVRGLFKADSTIPPFPDAIEFVGAGVALVHFPADGVFMSDVEERRGVVFVNTHKGSLRLEGDAEKLVYRKGLVVYKKQPPAQTSNFKVSGTYAFDRAISHNMPDSIEFAAPGVANVRYALHGVIKGKWVDTGTGVLVDSKPLGRLFLKKRDAELVYLVGTSEKVFRKQ